MKKHLSLTAVLAVVVLLAAACSLNTSTSIDQSIDPTFAGTGVSKTLTVPATTTATTVSLSGSATVSNGIISVYVLDPSNQPVYAKSYSSSTTSSSQTISTSLPIQTGTWTLRVMATGATGSVSVTLSY